MKAPSAQPRKATERDLLYFLTPELWDLHPFLPVVRYQSQGEIECGILYDQRQSSDSAGTSLTVYLTNIFTMPRTKEELLALPEESFESAEAMATGGWLVD